MEQLLLNNYLSEKTSKKGANCERNYWIDLTAQKLNRKFQQICGLVRDWPDDWIKDMFLHCEKSDNFSRLWWGLRKKK